MVDRKKLSSEDLKYLREFLMNSDIDEEEDDGDFMGRKLDRREFDQRRSDSQYHGTTWQDDI